MQDRGVISSISPSAGTIRLEQAHPLDLLVQELRRSPLTDHWRICSRLTPRLAQESAAQAHPSQLNRSGCEGDGPGANPGFLTNKNENAQRALKEIGLSASGFCSESNPSPGTKISTPVFGCELFVAQTEHRTIHGGGNRKLFTVIHQLFTNFDGPKVSGYPALVQIQSGARHAHRQFHCGVCRDHSTTTINHGGRMANHEHENDWEASSFEITSKRRKGFPSETRVKRGVRIVHGYKLLSEKLGRNDPCPCNSGRSF